MKTTIIITTILVAMTALFGVRYSKQEVVPLTTPVVEQVAPLLVAPIKAVKKTPVKVVEPAIPQLIVKPVVETPPTIAPTVAEIPVPHVETPKIITPEWTLETTFDNQELFTNIHVKGFPTWSNGTGTRSLSGCTIIWRRFMQPSGVLSSEVFYPMQQSDPNNFNLRVDLKHDKYVTVYTQCKTFGFDSTGKEITYTSPEVKND